MERVIAADLDEAVFDNKASVEQILIEDENELGIQQHLVDLIVADYVLEHIKDANRFAEQVDKYLKRGG